MQVDEFGYQIKAVGDRISSVHQKVNQLPLQQQKLLEDIYEEVRTTLEALKVTSETLRQQNQEERCRSLSTCSPIGIFLADEEELRQISTALENAVEGISRLDTQGHYIAVNKAYASTLGYQPKEMIGMPWQPTVHPEDLQKLMDGYQKMLKDGKAEVEARGVRKDGSLFHKQVVMVAAYNSQGRFLGHHCFAKDITDRKQALDALQHAKQELQIRVEERTAQLTATNDHLLTEIAERKRVEEELERSLSLLRATLEATVDGIIVSQNATSIVAFNQKFVEMWCIPESIIASHNLNQVLPLILEQLKDPDAFLDETNNLFSQPDLKGYGIFELKDGRVFERYSQPQHMGGKIVGRVCSFRDITESNRSQAALRKSEATNQALLNAIPDLMIRMTRDGAYLDFIPPKNFKSVVPEQELRGKNIYDVMPLDIAQERMHYIEQAFTTGEAQIYEFQLSWDDTKMSYEEARIVVSGEDEVLVMVRDITQRKQMEEALRLSEEQYRRIIETTSEGVWIIDGENKTVFANNTMAKMLGYTLDEMLITPLLAFIDEQWQSLTIAVLSYVKRRTQGIKESFDVQLRRKDGSELWAIVSANSIFDQAGRYVGALGMFTDITQRKRVEVEIQQSEQKYRNLFHNSLVGMFRSSLADGTVMDANEAALKMFGFNSYEGLKTVDLYVNPADRETIKQLLREKGFIENFEIQVQRKDGSAFWISSSAKLYAKEGYVEGVMIDITERKQSEEALRAKEEFLKLILDNIPQFIFWKDRNSVYLGCNQNFAIAAGVDNPEEIVGLTDYGLPWKKQEADFFRQSDTRIMETDTPEYHIIEPQLQADGKQAWLDTTKIPLHDAQGNVVGILGSYEDITERQLAQEKIRYQALHDLLTGLPNRTLFNDQLSVSLAEASDTQSLLAVMFLDLDRFKTINDTLGHAVGDRLLQGVAERLTTCLQDRGIVARWGGDELTVLLPQLICVEEAAKIAQRILDVLKQPFNLEGHQLHISSSIGIAVYPQNGEDAETLLINADAALYRVKQQGRNNYQFYTAAMNSQASELLVLENELHHALHRGEFIVYYQPQVNTTTGKITGMEALVRWQHPKLGLVTPAKFIPLAEETGLIVPIGEWVLKTACAQNKAWQDAGLPPLRIAVNLSARQFQQPSLLNVVAQTLQQIGLSPQFLELEITETIAMQDVELTKAMLSSLHQMGVQLSIDDFGTGYSSLGYLKQFPLHTLKIDKSFVRDVATDPQNAGIIQAIMTLGRGFNLRVIAEGVETEAEKDCLLTFQCEEMQGYLSSPPLPAQEATQLLRNSEPMKGQDFLTGVAVCKC